MNEEQPKLQGKIVLFEAVNEHWDEYNLADGNTLLIKNILLKVLDSGKKGPDGLPIYNVQGHMVVNVYSPEQGYVRMKR